MHHLHHTQNKPLTRIDFLPVKSVLWVIIMLIFIVVSV